MLEWDKQLMLNVFQIEEMKEKFRDDMSAVV